MNEDLDSGATQLSKQLSSTSETTFHAALARVREFANRAGPTALEIVVAVVTEFESQQALQPRVQADRIHALLRSLQLSEDALADLARRARTFSPAVRNAVSGFLSPAQRRLLVRQDRRPGDSAALKPSADEVPAGSASPTHGGGGPVPAPPEPPFSTVALLAEPFQDANTRRLAVAGFGAFVWPSFEKLEQDLASNSDLCACAVDGSVLQGMDESAQRRLFESLGSFSTFIWIRVDANHLKLKPEEVRACIHKVRCLREEVPASALSIQADGALRDFDLAEIEAASRSLRAGNAAEFVPGELTPNEANVLMAAAKLHARELQFEGHVEMTSLETRFLPGGRSTARIGVLRVNRSGRPLVAKIDAKSRVQDEMKRFRTFIQPWDDELRPKLHFHGEAAVILFGLVPNEMDRTKPAEVLEDRLRAVWNNQLFAANSDAELERQREALTLGVENAARRLGELNSTSPPSSELTPLGNPDVGATFDKLARAGIDWALAEVTKTAFEKASARFKKHEVSATIHGDVHLRNILVRGDRDAHLIDYAGSGPGHPSVDLVRLELALFLGALRQLDGEARCAEYQKRLSIDLDSYEVLEAAFPALHRCRLNQVCLRGSVAAREQALKVLGQYGGGQEDYLAAKYVIAWQHLVMFGSHTGLARAMIESLAPAIAAW